MPPIPTTSIYSTQIFRDIISLFVYVYLASSKPIRGTSVITHLGSPNYSLLYFRHHILVTLSASYQLNFVTSRRRTLAGWKGLELALCGAQLDSETTPYPLSRLLRIKPCLLPSLFLFLPPTCLPCPHCFTPRLAVRLLCFSKTATLFY